MTITRLRPSFTFTEERLAELRAVVPEAFADGRVNWEALKEALGEWTEAEGDDAEHFGLFWPGKREARRLAAKPSRGTLVPVPGEGVNEEATRNLFIEGDNLEVLKLLQKSYAGRVKMIYIDPPYNTGNDFVYKDDFRDPLGAYLRRTGQVDEAGDALTTNTRADGRFHSNWLSMMYPRLTLARSLLRDDGALFVSIGDEENANLKVLLAEVFGEENIVASLAVVRSEGGGLAKQVVKGHDYLYVVARDIDRFVPLRRPKDIRGQVVEVEDVSYWIEEDWLRREFGKYGTCEYGEITKYHGEAKKREIDEGLASGIYRLIKKRDGRVIVGRLRRVDEDGSKFYSVLKHLNAKAADDLADIGMPAVFDYPKPVSLIQEMVLGATFYSRSKEDIVVDFFAGSGTAAHAVWLQNLSDSGNRRWLLVQLPEQLDPSKAEQKKAAELCKELGKPLNIAELTKERMRRAAQHLSDAGGTECDLGFRVFRLDRSHFTAWQDYDGENVEQLEALFEEAETPLVGGWASEALLSEVLLLQGFPLDARIEAQTSLTRNDVRLVTSDHIGHRLWVCLDRKIHDATVAALAPTAEDVIVCLDSALDDEAKLRLADRCTLETI